MSNRVTDKQLEALVLRLNQALNRPLAPYARIDDKLVAQIGNYHLYHAYGGVCVHEMAGESGGVTHACGMYGCVPKRECADKLYAALWGIEAAQAA